MHQQRLAGRKRRSGSERLQGGLINHKNGRSAKENNTPTCRERENYVVCVAAWLIR